MLFEGDVTLPGYPPLSWTTVWKNKYSNIYGDYIGRPLRLWGYIFWDAPRLKGTGALTVLMRQWEDAWGQDDPRDVL